MRKSMKKSPPRGDGADGVVAPKPKGKPKGDGKGKKGGGEEGGGRGS